MDRVVKFRGRRLCDGRWEYGHYDKDSRGDVFIRHPDTENPKRIDVWQVDPDTVGQFTGLYDRNGKEIYEGDFLQFDDDCGIWVDSVVFERGLFGLGTHPRQIKNPDDWDKPYDKVRSRWWSSKWGHEEFGTAFTYRTPLAERTLYEGKNEDYENSEFYKIHKQHGFGKYYVFADIVGNIHDNPEPNNNPI